MAKRPQVEGSLAKKEKQVVVIEASHQAQPQKLRVAAYARVSSDSTDQLNSFLAQINHYSTYISSHEEWSFVDLYADEGISGTSAAKRPEFQRLVADCRRGLIDLVLCKSISRFARNSKDCLETLRELKDLGVGVYFEEQNIDSRTNGEFLTAVYAALAQKESESIAQNMRWGFQYRMSAGVYIPSSVPYGYDRHGNEISINEEQAAVVRQIFEGYLSGENMGMIAERLNKEGIRVKSNDPEQKWTFSSISYILSNEKYMGDSLWQKTYRTNTLPSRKEINHGEMAQYYAEGTHPAIISKEMFDRTQELKNGRYSKQGSRARKESVFHQKIFCGVCGRSFRKKVCRDITYWACINHNLKKENCPIEQVPESEIINAFLSAYHRIRLDGIQVLENLKENLTKIDERKLLWRIDIVELNKQIGDLMDQNRMLAEMQMHGLGDSDFFISKSNEVAKALREAQEKKENLIGAGRNRALVKTRELLEKLYSMPEYLSEFDEIIFEDLVEKAVVESSSCIRFKLINGVEISESLERPVR